MSDYGNFKNIQRRLEMEKEEEGFRPLNCVDRAWRRKQMAAEVAVWLAGMAIGLLIGYGLYSLFRGAPR